jgi:peptide/nickel transport system permease protein
VLRVSAILFYATPVFFAGLVASSSSRCGSAGCPSRGARRPHRARPRRDGGTGIYLIDAIASGNPAYVDVLLHAILPRSRWVSPAGIFLRLVRTNVIGTFNMPYIDAARSRGVREEPARHARVQARAHPDHHGHRPADRAHARRRGAHRDDLRVEGLGFQLAAYLSSRDFVAVQGIVAMIAIIVAVTNFIVDIIAAFIDPRRY